MSATLRDVLLVVSSFLALPSLGPAQEREEEAAAAETSPPAQPESAVPS
jgi:hypothetical protein